MLKILNSLQIIKNMLYYKHDMHVGILDKERDKAMGFRPVVGESGITYKVEQKEGIISKMSNGWQKELNKVSWNEGEAKFEIRSWSKDHQRMGKGVSFTEEELIALANILAGMSCVQGKIKLWADMPGDVQ